MNSWSRARAALNLEESERLPIEAAMHACRRMLIKR